MKLISQIVVLLFIGSAGIPMLLEASSVSTDSSTTNSGTHQEAETDRDDFSPAQIAFFENHIRPLFADHCSACHGPDKQESDLRLDSRSALFAGGASGEPLIDDENLADSFLLLVLRDKVGISMPPEHPLTAEQIARIEEWILDGAAWPAVNSEPTVLSMDERIAEERRDHWSLQPIRRPTIQIDPNDSWSYTAIDRIVFAQLTQNGLAPSPDADPRTLVRRLKFDLLGLPPSYRELIDFQNGNDEQAFQKLVDRYLASPSFGERWGRHWLDVARYGDTRGYAFARDRRYPYAYSYRDYVIGAFNQDKPFDRFVVEQLAADQLELGDDPTPLAAMGFLTTGRRFNNVHDDIADQIDAVTRGFLGLTVSCARCHDHKYDAIPTEDYYSLYGVFASATEPIDLPLIGTPEEIDEFQNHLGQIDQARSELAQYRTQIQNSLIEHARLHPADYLIRLIADNPAGSSLEQPMVELTDEEIYPKLLARWRVYLRRKARPDDPVFGLWTRLREIDSENFEQEVSTIVDELSGNSGSNFNPIIVQSFIATPPTNANELSEIYGRALVDLHREWLAAGGDDGAFRRLNDEQRQLGLTYYDDRSPTNIPDGELAEFLSESESNQISEFETHVNQISSKSPKPLPRAMIVQDRDQLFHPVVFIRGMATRRGDQVPRQFLSLLEGDSRQPFERGGGRLDLAERIIDRENPLTARVIANRVWMHHFGEPIVDEPSDFGIRSAAPVQLELLDYLASLLIDNNWSLKSLHREIVQSRVYQQASFDCPDCRSIDPDNRLLWKMNGRRLEFEPLRDALLSVSNQLNQQMHGPSVSLIGDSPSHRRAVYGTIDRQDLPNLFRVFDFASPDQSIARRSRTIVPQQALFLMNSPFTLDLARSLANSIDYDELGRDDAITRLYRRVFARDPSIHEMRLASTFLEQATHSTNDENLTKWQQFAHLLLLTNEFSYID